ncbi:TPA: hypothetical protein ACPZLH_001544 [Yersinia enterocolitica]
MSRTIESLITDLKAAAQEEIMFRESGDTSDRWQDDATPENVLRLVDLIECLIKQAQLRNLETQLSAMPRNKP